MEIKNHMRQLLVITCLLAAFSWAQDVDSQWEPNPNIHPSRLPVMLNVSLYDEFVVDYDTGKMISKEPWFIMLFSKNCPFCQMVKPELEILSDKVHEEFKVGMIDCH